jgi:hypothetical protein
MQVAKQLKKPSGSGCKNKNQQSVFLCIKTFHAAAIADQGNSKACEATGPVLDILNRAE